jgi:hypothetical protein
MTITEQDMRQVAAIILVQKKIERMTFDNCYVDEKGLFFLKKIVESSKRFRDLVFHLNAS